MMKLRTQLFSITLILAVITACATGSNQNEENTAKLEKEQIKQDFRQMKNEWEAKLNTEIEAIEKQIKRARADSELEKDLESAKLELEKNLGKIEKSTEKTWGNVVKEVDHAFSDIKNDLKDLRKKIEKELN